LTPAEKRAVIERIHAAWCAMPHQRLGQLIENSCRATSIYYAEDMTLAEWVEAFAREHAR
jgi:hypothetical protein